MEFDIEAIVEGPRPSREMLNTIVVDRVEDDFRAHGVVR